MSASAEIQLIAVTVAVACALPGVFLVLRQLAMMSDAISHAILPGIVIAFFMTEDLGSPMLILGAALSGVATVALVELLRKTGLLKEDAAIGIVFPALFSVGVILIARFAGDVHLDVDAVLLGELAFAPFDRLAIGSIEMPKALFVMGIILVLNIGFIVLFYKELKVATFDKALAASMGFAPLLLHYVLMGLVSTTAVGAFDAVGSILVVALMVAPPAAAYMLTHRLSTMLVISAFMGALAALGGYWMARFLDASIAGSMATMSGVLFVLVLSFAPERGLVSGMRRRASQRLEFGRKMLVIHLYNHEGLPEAKQECRVEHLEDHLRWDHQFALKAVRSCTGKGWVISADQHLKLTDEGRRMAQEAMV
jgi:manganese/zinc/iron transport system permease protein